MLELALIVGITGAAPPTPAPLHVEATLPAETLAVGEAYDAALRVTLDDGWSAATAGIPAPILQIDVPACVELEGKVLTERRELAKNEFLDAPFERMLETGDNAIRFRLVSQPQAGDVIALNVVAYVREGDDEEAWFIRRRLHLPVEAGATAVEADAGDTTWGGERDTLHVGDAADAFTLPRADGSTISLGDYRGKKNVIVTTYRAFW
jgi:hypothetical protein